MKAEVRRRGFGWRERVLVLGSCILDSCPHPKILASLEEFHVFSSQIHGHSTSSYHSADPSSHDDPEERKVKMRRKSEKTKGMSLTGENSTHPSYCVSDGTSLEFMLGKYEKDEKDGMGRRKGRRKRLKVESRLRTLIVRTRLDLYAYSCHPGRPVISSPTFHHNTSKMSLLPVLWKPTNEQIQSSLLNKFRKLANARYSLNLGEYRESPVQNHLLL